MQLQKQLKQLIAKGKLEQAVDMLLSIEKIEKNLSRNIVIQAQRFYHWKKERYSGLLTADVVEVKRNQIVLSLLQIVEELSEKAKTPKKQRSFFSFLPFFDTATTATEEVDVFAQEKDNIREHLIERYTERLRQKTDHRLPVSLQLTYSQEGMSADYPHFSKDIPLSESIEGTLTQTLQKQRHLLIIGNPGAGKTTQILELAKEWLTEKVDEKLPILFNLASWKPENDRFHEWLQSALVSGYGFSKKLAQEAILTNQILPLLDGLDEVGRDVEDLEERNDVRCQCLHAIDEYLSLFEVKYLTICSRRKEYAAINADAPVKAQILVNPLTAAEIRTTLKYSLTQKLSTKDENAANTLLALLDKNPILEEVLCTPFYYNSALEVFDSRSSNQSLPTTKTELEEYLIKYFIEEKLRVTSNRKGFLKEKTLGYLGWIGGLLNQEGKVVFELVDFKHRQLRKGWRIGVIYGLIGGLFFCIFGSLVQNLFFGIVGGVFFGGILGIKADIKQYHYVIVQDFRSIKLSRLLLVPTWKNIFIQSDKFTRDAGKFGMLLGSIIYPILSLSEHSINHIGDLFFLLLISIYIGYVGGFFTFLILSLPIGFLVSIVKELTEVSSFSITKTPYHRFKQEVLFNVIQWLSIIFIFFLITATAFEYFLTNTFVGYFLTTAFTVNNDWISIGVIIGLYNTALINHLILRLCLFLEQKLPLQLVHFLQYTTQARILEQDGGQWRFRHQILQDYFAERWGGVNKNG